VSKAKQQIPMPAVITIVGVVLVIAAGVLWMELNKPSSDTGVYQATEAPPSSGRAKAR